jgi:uncharacterized protein (DUF111 family)
MMLETNIDDLNPEIYEYVMTRLLEAGALDVTFNPIQMKKNRPGILLQVLCRPKDAENLTSILFTETSTLGVRKQNLERVSIPRSIQIIETPYGQIRMKIAQNQDGSIKFAPEYEDCRTLAETNNIPLVDMYKMAESLASDLLSS